MHTLPGGAGHVPPERIAEAARGLLADPGVGKRLRLAAPPPVPGTYHYAAVMFVNFCS